MLFASPIFLSVFLPATVGMALLTRKRLPLQNGLLVLWSLLFYAWGDPLNTLVLLGSVALNGACGRLALHRPRFGTALAVVFDLSLLFLFKYIGFFAEALNAATGLSLPVPSLALPLGISFFTFQGLSYVLDVARGNAKPCGNPLVLTLYICFFPQLIAGPIVRWADFAPQLRARRMTVEGLTRGLLRFIEGLARKVLLADTLAKLADAAFACPDAERNAVTALAGAAAFTMQLYLDFSGYSRMAVGLGEMLGFRLPRNFDHPLCAVSLRDFWRRWHITLSAWFREYVYIPLGGSRAGRARTVRNLMLVFLLTGLWHGASWTFVAWGAYNGVLVILEHMRLFRPDRLPRPLAHVLTLALIMAGFVLFRADSLSDALRYAASFTVFDFSGACLSRMAALFIPAALLAALAGMLCASGVIDRAARRLYAARSGQFALLTCGVLLLCACYAALLLGGYHPFLYFRF